MRDEGCATLLRPTAPTIAARTCLGVSGVSLNCARRGEGVGERVGDGVLFNHPINHEATPFVLPTPPHAGAKVSNMVAEQGFGRPYSATQHDQSPQIASPFGRGTLAPQTGVAIARTTLAIRSASVSLRSNGKPWICTMTSCLIGIGTIELDNGGAVVCFSAGRILSSTGLSRFEFESSCLALSLLRTLGRKARGLFR